MICKLYICIHVYGAWIVSIRSDQAGLFSLHVSLEKKERKRKTLTIKRIAQTRPFYVVGKLDVSMNPSMHVRLSPDILFERYKYRNSNANLLSRA
jgi:hypothetical protein